MSTRRLAAIVTVPACIKKVFKSAPEPVSSEERLWRERAARMTLDALGHTNLTMKWKRHNEAVRYARRWFRGLFDGYTVPGESGESDDPIATFDAAGLTGFIQVRDAALAGKPFILPARKDAHLGK